LHYVCPVKKIYTCSCNTTLTYKNSPTSYATEIFPGDKSAMDQKLTKKQATAACAHQQTAIQTNLTNGWTDNGKYPLEPGESITTECLVK